MAAGDNGGRRDGGAAGVDMHMHGGFSRTAFGTQVIVLQSLIVRFSLCKLCRIMQHRSMVGAVERDALSFRELSMMRTDVPDQQIDRSSVKSALEQGKRSRGICARYSCASVCTELANLDSRLRPLSRE